MSMLIRRWWQLCPRQRVARGWYQRTTFSMRKQQVVWKALKPLLAANAAPGPDRLTTYAKHLVKPRCCRYHLHSVSNIKQPLSSWPSWRRWYDRSHLDLAERGLRDRLVCLPSTSAYQRPCRAKPQPPGPRSGIQAAAGGAGKVDT